MTLGSEACRGEHLADSSPVFITRGETLTAFLSQGLENIVMLYERNILDAQESGMVNDCSGY